MAYHTGIEGIGVESRMTWVGIVAGVAATAVVGGLVALPALRLRGLYLALATLAFGGIMSTLVLREINVRHWFGLDIALFPNARLIVPRPKIGPLDLDENTTFLMALAVVFAVLGVARGGGPQQRLRPPAGRDAGQPGRDGDAGPVAGPAQARRVHAVRRRSPASAACCSRRPRARSPATTSSSPSAWCW